MKTKSKLLLAFVALLGGTFLMFPGIVLAYVLNGESLPIIRSGNGYQRDFRIRNDFSDPSANNNTVEEAMFPGAVGAPLAVWRGANAWNSQNGNAARNFDFDYQGLSTTSTGNENVVQGGYAGSGCGGSTLAFAELPSSNGWRIRFCEAAWIWSDGPGNPSGGQTDIRGVAAHEFGHVLGMGHSNATCGFSCTGRPTMCAGICFNGVDERSIEADDQAGLEDIYGTIPSVKPNLVSLGGSTNIGGTLIIEGSSFGSLNVRVKFTAETSVDVDPPGTDTVSPDSTTLIRCTVPAEAQTGNVLVWKHNASPRRLSNFLPITIGPALSPDCYGQKGGTPTPGTNGNPNIDLLYGPSITGNEWTEIEATGFEPNKTGFFLLSLTQSTVTWKSATNLNVGFPLVIPLVLVSSDSSGVVNLPFAIVDAPDFFGTIFWAQLLIRDDGGVDGFATTEALGIELCDDMID